VTAVLPADGPVIADSPVLEQLVALEGALRCNPNVVAITAWARDFALPSWYLGAGALAQTVWNQLHGFDPTHGIRDYDLVFFDSDDLGADRERRIEAIVRRDLDALGVTIDVKNQARVHRWYEARFGRAIPPYRSAEHAISTWPTTASSIGVRYDDDRLIVCAQFGLRDLLSMTVRANPTLIDRRVLEAKAARWLEVWPRLTVLPWPCRHEGEGQP
jgi:hypothetical protein